MVNWWLNLDRFEQAAKLTKVATFFEEPRVSATLQNNYSPPSKPKVIGVFDDYKLHMKCAEDSHPNHILHGGKEWRNFADARVVNAQLRDKAILNLPS